MIPYMQLVPTLKKINALSNIVLEMIRTECSRKEITHLNLLGLGNFRFQKNLGMILKLCSLGISCKLYETIQPKNSHLRNVLATS